VGRIDEAGDGTAPAAKPTGAQASKVEPAAPSASPAKPAAPPASAPARSAPASGKAGAEEEEAEELGPLSPLVRRMAREHSLDLRQIRGTGAGGRITKQDVEAYVAAKAAPAPAAPPAQAPSPAPAQAPEQVPPLPRVEPAKTRVEPMSVMRQRIAEHMTFSKHTSAHVTTVHRVDMTAVARLREKLKAEFQTRYGFTLTFLPFVARAAAEALRAFPIVNASIEGTNVLYHNEINVGIAVALDGGSGLIVPVIRHADERNVVGLQRAIVDLAARARGKQLKPDEVQGGTFSITNFGSFGSVFATPVINQPQVAILGVGAVEKTPVVIEDAIAIRSIAYLALTFDHRLIDGAIADQFCQKVKSVLENWSEQVL
jgi:2-oxoglutarate dehydrogenase E2 component (dihydrolipoamide succinyltransferase)